MRVERTSGAVLIETGMFAAMVAVVATALMMVVFAKDIVSAAAIGVAVGAVVAVAMWLLMRGTLEPPRGPGNIPTPATPPSAAGKPAAAPSAATPATSASVKAEATAPAPTAAEAAPASVGTAPAALSAARDGQPDDLKQIKGVGPKLEQLLHSMGYFHFDQIAAWSADEVAWVDDNIVGFKGRVTRDDWVSQARSLIAEG